jgi:hypothetical protein
MENRSNLSTLLIACGTIIVVASLVLIGHQNALSAADVRDHRTQSASLLRDSTVEQVTLSEWERPNQNVSYLTIAGGFWLIITGVINSRTRKAQDGASPSKPFGKDDLE